jgi:hypothetical protein
MGVGKTKVEKQSFEIPLRRGQKTKDKNIKGKDLKGRSHIVNI